MAGRDEMIEQLKKLQNLIETPGMPDDTAAALGQLSLLGMILVELREIKVLLAAKGL